MILVPIEVAVKAPVVDGVPVNGVCGSEVRKLTVGAAETELVSRASSGDDEMKGRKPKALSISRAFNMVIRQ